MATARITSGRAPAPMPSACSPTRICPPRRARSARALWRYANILSGGGQGARNARLITPLPGGSSPDHGPARSPSSVLVPGMPCPGRRVAPRARRLQSALLARAAPRLPEGTDFSLTPHVPGGGCEGYGLRPPRRIGGSGRAWVELPGDVVRRELTAGQSLRAHPRHIGMFDATGAVQVAEVQGVSGRDDTYHCAVLSGPGVVWLRSMRSSPGHGPRPARERAAG